MSKRPHDDESREERWRRKFKKYEAKLKKKRYIVDSDSELENYEENPEMGERWDAIIDDPYPTASPVRNASEDEAIILEETVPPETPGETTAPVVPEIPADAPDTAASMSAADAATTLDVDPELLKALGNFEEETTEWGESIVDQIALRLKPLLLNGIKKEDRELLLGKYPFPKNLTLAKAPTLNAEVSAMLSEQSRNRDKRLYSKQNQLGAVLSGVTKAMSLLLRKEHNISDILSILSDTSKILADSHHLETDTRRSLITPLIDKELIDPFKDRKRDEFLFGENLGEMVKNSRGIKKTGQLIQATTSTLNSRGPPTRGRQQKPYANRGGGQQRPYRRRAAPQPQQAPPMRRQPYAQPGPRRPPPPASSTANAGRPPATSTDRTAGTFH